MQKIKANIHLRNIRRNAELFSALTKKKLCAVVKANAYGHGAEEVVNALEGIADCFAVALLPEAMSIRLAACGKDVLVFTPPRTDEEAIAFLDNDFVATIGDLASAELLANVCAKRRKAARVHLKIHTGMNRYGLRTEDVAKVCTLLISAGVRVEGIYTHLYTFEWDVAYRQKAIFDEAIVTARAYFPTLTVHFGGTYAALLGEEFLYDMTRVGIGLYGYLPDGARNMRNVPSLRKGMTVFAQVVETRAYEFGGAGYGTPLPLESGDALSVCRYGYADGFLRSRENGVVGAEEQLNCLCMDVCIRKGARETGAWIPVLTDAADTAQKTGTISYEVLCAATRRAEFVYDWY